MNRLILLVLVVLFTACQPKAIAGEAVTVASGSYRNISPAQLRTMLQSKDFVLVNVHIPFAGTIPGTDLSIPYDEVQQNRTRLPSNPGTKIVLYCSSGRMSQIAAEELVSLGYSNIWNLEGGLADWQKAGYELEK